MGSLTSSTTSARALDALRRIVQTLRESAAEAQRKVGISGAQLFVLQQLAHKPLTINELAERTSTHQSSVSGVARSLEEAGLAIRQPVEGDHRKVALQLTPRGKQLVRRSPPVAQAALFEALERLPTAARSQLAQRLEQLAEEMGIEARAPMFFEEDKPLARKPGTSRRSRG
jgi:DNA-binding MarR family transcriptional regulator